MMAEIVASGSLSILSDGEWFLLIPLDSANDSTRSESPSKPDWSPCDGYDRLRCWVPQNPGSYLSLKAWRTRAHRRLQHTQGFVLDLQWDSIYVQLRQQSFRDSKEQDSLERRKEDQSIDPRPLN
ncbi:hypothetical protein PRIPAC_76083 [Pristionchus pacificus]|uniref:Uncharacterized protein n=1 Tax=Pristionchus pacificus TaxID=54126 RepID=A0A2A6B4A2_PRIPA|nr:hypothetical protein PRIPAC_76083 [Pristionchus pacificus]|eukprot:PDM60707.1 hypothetical protein PRIPAC_54513 [Pristionchus pacificus]